MSLFWIDIVLAVLLESAGLYLTSHLIWPRWKVVGKAFFYLGVSAVLAWFWPGWAMVFIIGHPLLGVGMHLWFCNHVGLDWRNVDSERYIEAQKSWVEGLGQSNT